MLRIVFMGTPDFAVPTLESLVAWPGGQVVAVVTAPDRPAGRGRQLQASAVKAGRRGPRPARAPAHQPESRRNFRPNSKATPPICRWWWPFRMLPEAVWNMPRLGSINIHASLLPQYRGAAPINWALMHGDQ